MLKFQVKMLSFDLFPGQKTNFGKNVNLVLIRWGLYDFMILFNALKSEFAYEQNLNMILIMEHPCPVQSSPCPQLEPPSKLLQTP